MTTEAVPIISCSISNNKKTEGEIILKQNRKKRKISENRSQDDAQIGNSGTITETKRLPHLSGITQEDRTNQDNRLERNTNEETRISYNNPGFIPLTQEDLISLIDGIAQKRSYEITKQILEEQAFKKRRTNNYIPPQPNELVFQNGGGVLNVPTPPPITQLNTQPTTQNPHQIIALPQNYLNPISPIISKDSIAIQTSEGNLQLKLAPTNKISTPFQLIYGSLNLLKSQIPSLNPTQIQNQLDYLMRITDKLESCPNLNLIVKYDEAFRKAQQEKNFQFDQTILSLETDYLNKIQQTYLQQIKMNQRTPFSQNTEICRNWNSKGCIYKNCKRRHICLTCQGNHSAKQCPQNIPPISKDQIKKN